MKKLSVAVGLLAICALLGTTTPAPAEQPILIGVPTALTTREGGECLKAVQMAVDEINARGGVKVGKVKRPLQIETADLRDASPGVPVSEALLGLEKIITEKKISAIVVGPFRSEALLAGMDIIAKYKMPTLCTIAMTPKTAEKFKSDPAKYKYYFRVCLNAIHFVRYMVSTLDFMKKEFGFNKLYAMHQDVLWATATAKGTEKVASSKFGWEILGTEVYPTGSSDFSAGLMKAKSKGAQVIFPVFDMPQSGILLKQWRSLKIPTVVMGYIAMMTGPGAWKTFEGKIGGLMNASAEIGSGIGPKKYAPAKKFYDAYQKKYGVPMEAGHGPAPTYDAVYILAEAIERAGSLNPDKLVEEIQKTDRKGVVGRIKFDDAHQVIYGNDPTKTATGCMSQWTEDGHRVIVFPKSLAEGSIKLPAWMKAPK